MMQNSKFPAWLFILIGLGLTAWGAYFYTKAGASTSWLQVQGTIVESRVEKDWLHSGNRPGGQPSYQAVVRYEYVVDGHTYTGDRIAFGQSSKYSGGEQEARAAVDKYAEGDSTDVYYDPEDPASATLEREARGFAPAALLCGILFVAVSLLIRWAQKHQSG